MITSKFFSITTKKGNNSSTDGANAPDALGVNALGGSPFDARNAPDAPNAPNAPNAPDAPDALGGSPLILLLRGIINILEPIFAHAFL